MLRTVIAAAAVLCAFFSQGADARPREQLAVGCNELWPCDVPASAHNNFLFGIRLIDVEMKKEKRKPRPGRARTEQRAPSADLLQLMQSGADRVARPGRYIAGRLICAINVNAALAERGIRGTGSAVAKSFLGWGRASGPVPGAIAVSSRGRRGGHVAIVSRVEGGRVYVWNPSPRGRGWQEQAYRHRAISFRVPS
jgi:hypothetical protein